MKIMSNEQLVFSYRDALKSDKEKEWIKILKDEIKRRGLKPFKNRQNKPNKKPLKGFSGFFNN